MKQTEKRVVWMVAAMLLCAGTGWTNAAVVSFQDGFNGYTGTADTYIDTKYKSTMNYGGFGWTMAATPDARFNAGLMRFDDIFGAGAGQIPAGQTIVSATLVLHSPQQTLSISTNPHNAEMIADPMTTSWVEGTATRAVAWQGQAIEGATVGLYRHYRADGQYASHPEDTWGLDGLSHMGPTASDYNTVLGATYTMDSATYGTLNSHVEPVDYFSSISHDVVEFDVTAAVRAWADGTLANNGWYLRAWTAYSWQYYYSSDYAVNVTGTEANPIDLSLRPKLIVEYTPEPATMALLLLGLPALIKRRKR